MPWKKPVKEYQCKEDRNHQIYIKITHIKRFFQNHLGETSLSQKFWIILEITICSFWKDTAKIRSSKKDECRKNALQTKVSSEERFQELFFIKK